MSIHSHSANSILLPSLFRFCSANSILWLFILIASLSIGCQPLSPSGEAQVALQWSFVDGRDCKTSGVSAIEIVLETIEPLIVPCTIGIENAFSLGQVPAVVQTLEVNALSSNGNLLYNAEETIVLDEGSAQELRLVLFFASGNFLYITPEKPKRRTH